MASRLKSLDLFRHIPKDLTEATKVGGCVSIVAVVALCLLCFLEVRSLMAVSTNTKIAVSHREDDYFRVNLNITFPSISCNWISVDYVDIVGHRKTNITGSEIHKHTLHGKYVASAVREYDQPHEEEPVNATTPEAKPAAADQQVEVVIEGDKVVQITEAQFQKTINEHRVAVVNFYAPWCPFCVAMAPVYEQAAQLVTKRVEGSHELIMASVNCVDKENFQLCRGQHIQVFPTIRVYRDGSNNMNAKVHMHEEYRGPRTAEAMAEFVVNVFNAVKQQAAPGSTGTPQVEGAKPAPTPEGKKQAYSEYSTVGCVVNGHIKVSRIPGTILFVPTAAGHNFHTEAINMSHVINHLSFGADVESQSQPKKKNRKAYYSDDGAYSGDHDGTLFLSMTGRITHEHFLKVVQSVHEYLYGYVRETYEYTVNSNLYKTPTEDLPTVKMVWDIWPMEVIHSETRKPIVEGICQMVGFLGGVYAAFLMIERLMTGTWRELTKAREGKLG